MQDDIGQIAGVIPLYVAFLIIMAAVGRLAARALHLDPPAGRALLFSGATRSSLVVLPLALALPASFALAAAVIVTRTLVEVLGMLAYVRRLLPTAAA